MSTESTLSNTIEVAGPMFAPPHPGELVAEVIEELGMTVKAAAEELRVTRQTLHRVMAGTVAVTPEMALRLGQWAGNGPDLWLRMQQAHDLWEARQRLAGELDGIPSHRLAAA